MAASKIHKFLTSLMKLLLEMKVLLDFTTLKSSVGISYKPAQNMFKVNNKDIKMTSIDLPPVCRFKGSCVMLKLNPCETHAKELFGSKSCKFTKNRTFYIFSFISVIQRMAEGATGGVL